MKKSTCYIGLCALWSMLMLTNCTSSTPPATSMNLVSCASIPVARVSATSFVIGDTAYVFSGRDSIGTHHNDLWCYIASEDKWMHRGTTPLTPRVNAASCVVDGVAYIGLGFHGSIRDTASYKRDFWSFVPATNTWTRLADYPAQTTDKAVCMANSEYIYVAYGNGGPFKRDVYEYTIATNTWRQLPDNTSSQGYPPRTMGAVGAACNGRFFLGSGFNTNSRRFWVELIPHQSGIWSKKADMPGGGRVLAACAASEQYIYVAGGWYQGGSVTDGYYHDGIIRYSPAEDQWTFCAVFPHGGLENLVAFTLHQNLYVGLGEDQYGRAQRALYKLLEQ